MSIPLYQIDSFANAPFEGNPAAVCLMSHPASDEWLQNVAIEMNLSETAFVWKEDDGFRIRWFTPGTEVDLCGHATLAAAHAIWEHKWESADEIVFHSRSGILRAAQRDENIWLDFPAEVPEPSETNEAIVRALGVHNIKWFGKNRFDFYVELENEQAVLDCTPNFFELGKITERGAIVTASAETGSGDVRVDFVSRFFGPACGIDEDPVTGSAHVGLGPYWAQKMKKDELIGFQASSRGGFVTVRVDDARVHLGGKAITIFKTELMIEPE